MVNKVPMIRESAKLNIKESQDKMKQRDNIKETQFQIGDEVLIKKSWLGKSLGPNWEGPYEIIKIFSHGTYAVRNYDGTQSKAINGDRLKLFHRRKNLTPIIVIEN
jgi:hypothetical protein